MSRMPPPEGHHGPPPVPHTYEPAWRPPYAPHYDSHGHAPDRRPPTTQATLPPPNYPAMHGRELPQLHLEGPYSRPGSLPGPGPPVQDPHASQHGYRPPMNGTPHDTSPHSAPPEYRAPRIGYQPPEPGPGETTPTSGPLPPPSQFMSPAPVSAPTPAPYGSEYYQSAAYGMRQRKAARAQQACDQCRARKAKCDEGRPECSHCKENGLKCVYKEVPSNKQDKSIQPIMNSIMHFKDEVLQELRRILNGQEHNTHQISQLLNGGNFASLSAADQSGLSQISMPVPPGDLPVKVESQVLPPIDPATEKSPYGQQQRLDPAALSFDETILKGDNEGELSIPLEHTTAAHKLLMWPSIKKLLTPHDYDKDYVMGLEGQRGVTSIFDRGENSFSADGSFLPWNQPTPNGDLNAQMQSGLASWAGSALQDSDADISRFGILRIDGKTVKRYFHSYLNQMHLLHPFLNQRELEPKVDTFIQCYCPTDSNSLCREKKRKRSVEDVDGSGRDGSTKPPVGLNMDCAIVLLVIAVGAICETKSPLPGPVMDQEADYRQQFIPGPRQPIPLSGNGTNTVNGFLSPANSDSALPSNSSFYAPFEGTSHSFPSSAIESRSDRAPMRRSTIHDSQPKNYQVIPGLALYGYAIQTLALLHSGIHLEHVQANLLAGIYAGQLAHPFSSHSHIHKAAWACQVLVASKEYKSLEGGPTQDLINFVYWTCLQLESDLLAELDIPASGISRSESMIPLPKGKWSIIPLSNDMEDPHVLMMMFYSAQIHLRKVLNRVHTDLYKVEKEGENRWSSSVQEALSHNLHMWRFGLPEIMGWDDADPPAKEINAARMRAKYYGARYIIHRPLLYHALHYGGSGARVDTAGQGSVDSPTGSVGNSKPQQMSPSITNTSQRAQNMTRMLSDIGTVSANPAAAFPNGWTPPTVNLRALPSKLRRACKVCVDSAILSTQAFDGIEDPFEALSNTFKEEPFKSMQDPLEGHRMEDPFAMDPNFTSKDEKNRLVVTNIFGTAHAQFGNLLVLSATYMSSLSELVDRNELKTLLKRTIRFLLRSEHISPTLRADARILTEIYKKIFHHSPTLDKPSTP